MTSDQEVNLETFSFILDEIKELNYKVEELERENRDMNKWISRLENDTDFSRDRYID